MTGPGRGPVIATLLIAGLSCSGNPKKPAHPQVPIRLRLPALDGGEIDLARYRGRIVVAHLFTTWSATALDVEQLTAAHQANRDLVVLGIALDPEGYRFVAPWREVMKTPYLIALATDAVRRGKSSIGRIVEVPTTLIIDRDGTLARRVSGPLKPQQLAKLLSRLRGKSP